MVKNNFGSHQEEPENWAGRRKRELPPKSDFFPNSKEIEQLLPLLDKLLHRKPSENCDLPALNLYSSNDQGAQPEQIKSDRASDHAKGRSSKLELPGDVQHDMRTGLAQMRFDTTKVAPGLQRALTSANRHGVLEETKDAINSRLAQQGLGHLSLKEMPPSQPGAARFLALHDSRNGRVVDVVGPLVDQPGFVISGVRGESDSGAGANNAPHSAKARQTLREIESSGKPELVKRLSDDAKTGNDEARAALIPLILSPRSAPDWQSSARIGHLYGARELPDLTKLTGQDQERIKLEAISALRDVAKQNGGFTRSEASALAFTLKDLVEKGQGAGELALAIRGAFADVYAEKIDLAKDGPKAKEFAKRTEAVLNGLYDVLAPLTSGPAGVSGGRSVAELYGTVAASANNRFVFDQRDKGSATRFGDVGSSIKRHLEDFEDSARKGNRDSIAVLAAFASGAGRFNTAVNEQVRTPGRVTYEPGNNLALRASRDLVDIAKQTPALRQAVMDELLAQSQVKGTPDNGCRLETLGRVSALGNVPEGVHDVLRGALKDAVTEDSAARGMMAMARHLNSKDVVAITDNLTPPMVSALERSAFKLTESRGVELTHRLIERALNESLSVDQRAAALKAVAAVGAHHASSEDIALLKGFGGKAGRENLERQFAIDPVPTVSGEKPKRDQSIDLLQAAAGSALLGIAERSPEEARKSEALRAYASRDWPKQDPFPEFGAQHHRLRKMLADNPGNTTLQEIIPKLLYEEAFSFPGSRGAETTGRMAALFRELGHKGRESVVLDSIEKAMQRTGAGGVRHTAESLALFNALPPDVRHQLTASDSPLPDGQKLSLAGRRIDANTFNSLAPDVRAALFGSDALMLEADVLRFPRGATVDAGTYNSLPHDLRKALSQDGSGARMIQSQSVSVGGKDIDAGTFNALTADQRKALSYAAGQNISFLRESIKIPDLSSVRLSAEQFNSLDPVVKTLLGRPDASLRSGEVFSLSGLSLDAKLLRAMPQSVQNAITGSPNPIADGRVVKDLSQSFLDAKAFNGLAPTQRRALSGTERPLDAAQVLGLLGNGSIGEPGSSAAILTGKPPLRERVLSFAERNEQETHQERANLKALIDVRSKYTKQLAEHAKEGVGWFNKLKDYLGVDWSEEQQRFMKKQGGKVFDLASLDMVIRDQTKVVADKEATQKALQIALAEQKFVSLRAQGKEIEADRWAAASLGEFGRPLLAQAPQLGRALLSVGEGVEASPFKRLASAGESQFVKPLLNKHIGSKEGFESGIALLQQIKPKVAKDGRTDQIDHVDGPAIRKEALLGIDLEPTVRKLNRLSEQSNEQLRVLSSEIGIMQSGGDRFHDLIDDASRRAKIVQNSFASLEPQELQRLYELRTSMEKALREGGISDQSARLELSKRFEALNRGLALFDPAYDRERMQPEKMKKIRELETKVAELERDSVRWADKQPSKEVAQSLRDTHPGENYRSLVHAYWRGEHGKLTEQLSKLRREVDPRGNVDKLLGFLEKPEAKEASTFVQWLKTDGAELAGTMAGVVVATAAVVATFGTAAPAIALGATATAGGIAGRELTKEGQRFAGVRSDGALLGDYTRGVTVQNPDGSTRAMELGKDVVVPYLTELGVGTSVGWASCGLGSAIGRGLASGYRSLFVAEHAQTLGHLAENLGAIDALTNHSPWFARFASEALKQAGLQSALLPVSMGMEHGTQNVLKAAGMAAREGQVLTSFISGAALSAPFGAMQPRVKPAGKAATKEGGPRLNVEYHAAPETVAEYVATARVKGSLIEEKANGRFIETTKEGVVIDWSKAPDVVATKPGFERPPGELPSLSEKVVQPVDVSALKMDRDGLVRMRDELREMMRPVTAEMERLARLNHEYTLYENDMLARLDKIPETPAGEIEFNRLNGELKVRNEAYQRQRAEIEEAATVAETEVKKSDRYRQLKMAEDIAGGEFPAGEYLLRVPGKGMIGLNVGSELVETPDGKLARRVVDNPVPTQHVDRLLTALDAAKIVPDRISIMNKQFASTGSLTPMGRLYEVSINVPGDQPLRLIFNHENGHLYDCKYFRKNASQGVQDKINFLYKAALQAPDGPADVYAKKFGIQPTPAFREQFALELSDPANFDYTVGRIKTKEDKSKYLAARSEVFAEMHKLYCERQRVFKETGKTSSYEELLKDYTERYSPERAAMMRKMGDLYAALEKDAFEVFRLTPAKDAPKDLRPLTGTVNSDAPLVSVGAPMESSLSPTKTRVVMDITVDPKLDRQQQISAFREAFASFKFREPRDLEDLEFRFNFPKGTKQEAKDLAVSIFEDEVIRKSPPYRKHANVGLVVEDPPKPAAPVEKSPEPAKPKITCNQPLMMPFGSTTEIRVVVNVNEMPSKVSDKEAAMREAFGALKMRDPRSDEDFRIKLILPKGSTDEDVAIANRVFLNSIIQSNRELRARASVSAEKIP